MMFNRLLPPIFILIALLGMTIFVVQAETICETYWDPVDQSWVTVCSDEDGGSSIGGGNRGDDEENGEVCIAGSTVVSTVVIGGGGLCEVWEIRHDSCTGQVSFANLVNVIEGGSCTFASTGPGSEPEFNPCSVIEVTAAGVYCQTDWGIRWLLDARVGFPYAHLDIYPYPATLVRWPSNVRNGGTPQMRGSGELDYIGYGGGDEEDPELGDWDNVRLVLTLKPASSLMFFSMPTIGTLALPDVGENGAPTRVVFEQPSHPETGATAAAGSVGLGELAEDFPVFSGSAVTAYRLFWRLTYQKYVRQCVPGPEPSSGRLECKVDRNAASNDGHWTYLWRNRSKSGEITPQMILNLPSGMGADLDGDGSPDAFWNKKVNVRRMDEYNRIDNPAWRASWRWGGSVYWGVREGQGQIGSP